MRIGIDSDDFVCAFVSYVIGAICGVLLVKDAFIIHAIVKANVIASSSSNWITMVILDLELMSHILKSITLLIVVFFSIFVVPYNTELITSKIKNIFK